MRIQLVHREEGWMIYQPIVDPSYPPLFVSGPYPTKEEAAAQYPKEWRFLLVEWNDPESKRPTIYKWDIPEEPQEI